MKFRAPGGTIAELVPHRPLQAAREADHKIDRIVHLSLKVDDVEKTGDFYQQVFGFRDSRDEQDPRPRLAPHDRRRHRLHAHEVRRGHRLGGVEGRGRRPVHPPLRDRGGRCRKATEQVKSYGSEVVSDPGVIPVKFRAPGGTIAELVPLGRYKR